MNDDVRYCTECGKELTPSDRFCPACGANVDNMGEGSVAEQTVGYGTAYGGANGSNPLRILSYLMLFWGMIGTLYGIYTVMTADMTAENAVKSLEDMGYWETFTSLGYGEGTLRTISYAEGACMMVSGLSALVAGLFTYKGESYKVALMACIVATVAAMFGIITLLIGAFVTYRLSKNKFAFKS